MLYVIKTKVVMLQNSTIKKLHTLYKRILFTNLQTKKKEKQPYIITSLILIGAQHFVKSE